MADEELMRVRVYPDDWEMQFIYAAFVRVREDSRSKRGRARRGVESEFIRRLLIAGFRHLYGEFPRPGAEKAPGPRPAPTSTGDVRQDKNGSDITTNVAQASRHGSNAGSDPTKEPTPSAPEGRKKPGVDMSHLLQGGNGTTRE